jgi:hypothetical protein
MRIGARKLSYAVTSCGSLFVLPLYVSQFSVFVSAAFNWQTLQNFDDVIKNFVFVISKASLF